MAECMQSEHMNVLEHGHAVSSAFEQLLAVLEGVADLPKGWRIPSWLTPGSAACAHLLRRLAPRDVLRNYQVWHDCGKPYCIQLDEQGRRHFPGHANHSARIWRALGNHEREARLMAQDMDAHLLRAEDLVEFASREDAASLWMTALAEVHANAEMFGGWDSTSFKAKVKHLGRRGKALVALWEGHPSKTPSSASSDILSSLEPADLPSPA